MSVTRTFLPWYRAGFATAIVGAPSTGARARLPSTISLRSSQLTQSIPAELAGPADVIALDGREILRVEPYEGAPDFEPSYFPYVEFAEPDLPWRFSPFGAETASLSDPEHASNAPLQQTLVRPWLMLVAIPAGAVTISGAQPGSLPVMTTDAAQLPDPGEAWAWAHVQVITTDGQQISDALTDPSRSLSRLVCPQRLLAATRYIAGLVPTFSVARTALTGAPPEAAPFAPAWSMGSGTVQLPVYFQWSFTTGEAGSFETYARRLRPTAAPRSLSGCAVSTDRPGWGASGAPGASTIVQGALRPFGASEGSPDATLGESIRLAVSATESGVQLRPPLYGQSYQGGATSIPAGAGGWFAELNTDPRRRVAAGLAAWAVTVEQEDLVDRAWEQLGQSAAAPQPARTSVAAVVRTSMGTRHASAALSPASPPLARFARAGGPWSQVGATALGLAAVSAATTRLAPSIGAMQPEQELAAPRTIAGATAPSATLFTPNFPEPAYTFLRAVAPEWLLPGAADIPTESILLVGSNPQFIEAFMVGINHALARELAWRQCPLEPTGTMFRNFWTSVSGGDSEFDTIESWRAASSLGTHSRSPDQLVLLVRGELLRRFPTAVLYLSRTHPDGSEAHLTPTIAGALSTDIRFFGFPLTPSEAMHPTDNQPPGTTGWSIVIQEAPQHTRFGVEDSGSSGTALTTWQDLTWDHPHLRGQQYVAVGATKGGSSPLMGVTRPVGPAAQSQATWGLSSGHLSVIFQRPTFRIRIPVALWLGPLLAS